MVGHGPIHPSVLAFAAGIPPAGASTEMTQSAVPK